MREDIAKCPQLDYISGTGNLRLRSLETSFQESSSNALLLYFTHCHLHSAYGLLIQIGLFLCSLILMNLCTHQEMPYILLYKVGEILTFIW